jgi:hypothetical protein
MGEVRRRTGAPWGRDEGKEWRGVVWEMGRGQKDKLD